MYIDAAKHTAGGGMCAGPGLPEVMLCDGGSKMVPEERGSVILMSPGNSFLCNKPSVFGPLKDFMTATYI